MIHLPSVKTFVYTVTKNEDRRNNIVKMMSKLGFTNWSFVFGKDDKNLEYWQCIHDDWISMLNTKPPFLILEDDVDVTENYKSEIEYPSDAHLVYLGGTRNADDMHLKEIAKAAKRNNKTLIHDEEFVYTEYDENYIQIYNMHSTHAVLFVDDYSRHNFQYIINVNRQMPVDVAFALTHPFFRVYLVKYPFWYQNDGHNNEKTSNYYRS